MRIAVLGLGFMGGVHLRAWRQVAGATLAAVFSNDERQLSGDLTAAQGNLGQPSERFDFSAVKQAVDELRAQGASDVHAHLLAHADELRRIAHLVRVLQVNESAVDLFGAAGKDDLLAGLSDGLIEGALPRFAEQVAAVAEGSASVEVEGSSRTLSGEPLDVIVRWSVIPGHQIVGEVVGAGTRVVSGWRQILDDPDDIWSSSDMILGVKEPVAVEYPRLGMKKDQVLFTYLHLAASRECTDALVAGALVEYARVSGQDLVDIVRTDTHSQAGAPKSPPLPAPEVDGAIRITDCPGAKPGQFVNARIVEADVYDVTAVLEAALARTALDMQVDPARLVVPLPLRQRLLLHRAQTCRPGRNPGQKDNRQGGQDFFHARDWLNSNSCHGFVSQAGCNYI